jgi:class 3 adenylate cyclase/predicted ATPase
MQPIAEWLDKLGLGQYAQRFAENGIDLSDLRHLTDQDLKDIGVLLGHRRRMLAAIKELAGAVPATLQPTAETEPKAHDAAERRQLTVMFCDLVGSTALSARLDPEDLRGIIGAYHRCCTEAIERNGGFVAKYMGDGVLSYFGYPHAHEHDAERAVRAGLALVEAVPKLTTAAGMPLQVRVGIATGLVVVGDLIGSGEAQERGIVGETPNLAARLQGIAEPNTVIIADSTRRLLGTLFELQDLGTRDLKGIATPVRHWAALRPSLVESRFEALHAGGLTELVGREEELELLLRRWSKAKTSEGQVVLLSGEAGIGKSRVSATLLERLATEPHTRLRYFCSPHHTDSALYPIIGQMERAAGLTHEDTPQTKLDKLDAVLAQTSTSIEDASLFAEMLSLPNDGRYPTLDLTPQQRKQRTLKALISQLEALARQSSVLMIFEDAHWTDPTSLEVFSRAVERIETMRVLLIVTFRPEFDPPWIGQPHVTVMTINRLARRDVGTMIDRVVDNKLLPTSIRQDIIDRTDGIPLFVEEMTKAVLEAESEGAAQRTAAAVPSPALAVPASLHASLMARLDRLGPAKEVAQIAAAIGREFPHALLAPLVRKPEVQLRSALDRLVVAGLLFRQGVPPHATYLFKHALVQDAAYGTLLRGPRQRLHSQIASLLEERFADRANAEPELLARHFSEAGEIERAISYWLAAGRRAVERSADEEAIHHLSRGLTMLETVPESAERDRQEIEFQLALGSPLTARRGYNSPVVGAARDRAIALCERLGDTRRLLPYLYGQFIYCLTRGRIPLALAYAKRCQSLATELSDQSTELLAHRVLGSALLEMGKFESARRELEFMLAEQYAEHDRALASQYVTAPRASGLAFLALTLWVLGYPEQAVAVREQAFAGAEQVAHPNTTGFVHIYAGAELSTLLGDMNHAKVYLEKVIALSEERMPHWMGIGQLLTGWVLGSAGKVENGVSLMQAGWRLSEALFGEQTLVEQCLPLGVHSPHFLSLLAILQASAGNGQEGLHTIERAKDMIVGTGEYLWHSDVLRIDGELRRLLGAPVEKAEECFVRALTVAREQRAKAFELRAATSLARLWGNLGRTADAHDLLAPIYGWFTEGFDTLDLKQAKALLDELT